MKKSAFFVFLLVLTLGVTSAFALTDDEMAQIAALNKNVRYYTSTPEMLKKYAEMVPPVDEQK